MECIEYQKLSEKTMSDKFFLSVEETRMLHGAIGIVTEVTEIYEAAAKIPIDVINLVEEVSDILWYCAIFERELGFCLNENDPDFEEEDCNNLFINMGGILKYLTIESGTILDILKKAAFYGKKLDRDSTISHCRKIFLACHTLLDIAGSSIQEARIINISKLRKRYGEKFSEDKAINRDVKAEREILENK